MTGTPQLPDVPGLLTADEVRRSGAVIAALQLPNGMISWYPGGHCDPWNHVETAMALSVAGFHAEAVRAYGWLAATQRRDGSWHNYYLPDGSIEDTKLDTNVCAYIATGVWHHWLASNDHGFVERFFPVVERALDWVLSLQTPRGEVIWARHVDGKPWSYALLTGSSSICHSLRCALAIAASLGRELPDWELSLLSLASVIRDDPHAFAPKDRWAMDWYYPVLGGALTGDAAVLRLAERWDEFVIEGSGVRCVSNQPWVTAAETCECALAHLAIGDAATALQLFGWAQAHRTDNGDYLTGLVHPDGISFPDGERTAYTAAAVILTADALSSTTTASGLFLGDGLLPVGE
jgi:hypothetical protein